MEIGMDSFAARFSKAAASSLNDVDAMTQLLERIELADKAGLDVIGIGEHHREGFLDSAPALILSAAAARTKRIRLTSAVAVLSAADPVRVFEEFATLDLISQGRAEMVVGRGSFIDAFPLFGYDLHDYDALFVEKLGLLLSIRDNESWRLSEAVAKSIADMDRRRRNTTVFCSRRHTRPAAHGCCDRWRNAQLSSTGGPL
jgi:alkanesulfonate monooxygenase SsuD/methylene tetrahydromethanopterin reductase-like flavin-dependent oxidoreductase (luciferase family)